MHVFRVMGSEEFDSWKSFLSIVTLFRCDVWQVPESSVTFVLFNAFRGALITRDFGRFPRRIEKDGWFKRRKDI